MRYLKVIKPDLEGFRTEDFQRYEIIKKVTPGDMRKVVWIFKVVSGFEHDKGWDAIYYPRCMRAAKNLIEFLGDWRTAGRCVEDIHEKLTELGLTCTMETIMKHAANWKKDQQEKKR